MRPRAQRGERCRQIPAELGRTQEPGGVGCRQRGGQLIAMHPELHGIGAGLEHGNDARIGHAGAKSRQGRLDGGRMMRKIIVHRNPTDHSAHLHAAFDTTELSQGLGRLLGGNAELVRGRDRRERVHDVVRSEHRPAHPGRLALVLHDGELAPGGIRLGRRAPRCIPGLQAEGLTRGPTTLADDRGNLGVVAVLDDAAGRRHRAQ